MCRGAVLFSGHLQIQDGTYRWSLVTRVQKVEDGHIQIQDGRVFAVRFKMAVYALSDVTVVGATEVSAAMPAQRSGWHHWLPDAIAATAASAAAATAVVVALAVVVIVIAVVAARCRLPVRVAAAQLEGTQPVL